MKRILSHMATIFFITQLFGCMGYQLAGSNPKKFGTVYTAPVINKTTESAIERSVTHALRARLQFDGRVKTAATPQQADTHLEVTLTHYSIHAIAFRKEKERRTTAREYRIRLSAKATLVDAKTGRVVASANNYGEAIFAFTSDLTSAKRNASRAVADDLAAYLIDDLVEQWQ